MLPIEIYNLYRARIEYIKRHSHELSRIEALSPVNGIRSIDTIVDMVHKAVDEIKSYVAFLREPFEPATLDNYLEAFYDAGSQMQVFEQTPSDAKFDSRVIFDADKLKECVDDILRTITLLGFLPKKIEMPMNIIKLDLCIDSILRGLYFTMRGEKDDTPANATLTGRQITDGTPPLITFVKLNEQKYFTQEERDAINKREDAKRAAIAKAEHEAQIIKVASEYRNHLGNILINTPDDVIASTGPIMQTVCMLIRAAAGEKISSDDPTHSHIEAVCKDLRKYNDISIVINQGAVNQTVRVKDLANVNRIFYSATSIDGNVGNAYLKCDTRIYGSELEDHDDETPISSDTILTLYVEY